MKNLYNKPLAVILAIFLGGLGIHKFYQGRYIAGFIDLEHEKSRRDKIIESMNVPGVRLVLRNARSACLDCRDLPEGEVFKGHDHRSI